MGVTVSMEGQYNDVTTVILENEKLHVVIMPELGAKIWQITYKPQVKPLLWHHPQLILAKVPFGSGYDDHFYGGWDELYPNDMPETLNGRAEPDHGEIWGLPWAYELELETEDEVTLHMWVDTVVCASRMEKRITLKSGEAKLHFRHRLTNRGDADQPFLWKLHVALAIDETSRIDLGAKMMYMDIYGNPRNGQTQVNYPWPFLKDGNGNEHDMRRVLPADDKIKELQYATEMAAGWCALTHVREQVGLGLVFDLDVMPLCWVFGSYGGWRGQELVILEPATGYPMFVNDGIAAGTHRTIKPGESLECEVLAVVYEGISGVAHIDKTGQVHGFTEGETTTTQQREMSYENNRG